MKILIFFLLSFKAFTAYTQCVVFDYNSQSINNLKSFISTKEQLDSVSFVQIDGLTNNYIYPFTNKKIELKDGIYSLRSGISHKPTYIFLKKGRTITILENYSLEFIMENYKKFLKSIEISYAFKSKCLERIIYICIERDRLLYGADVN